MKDRYEILHDNFLKRVQALDFPPSRSSVEANEVALTRQQILALFKSQVFSRHLDSMARILKQSNQSFYTIGSSGHEGNAAIAQVFQSSDPAFLHYRSGAFFIERNA